MKNHVDENLGTLAVWAYRSISLPVPTDSRFARLSGDDHPEFVVWTGIMSAGR